MRIITLLLSLNCLLFSLYGEVDFTSKTVIKKRAKEGKGVLAICKQYAQFYQLNPNQSYRDITEELLSSPYTIERHKSIIRETKRRIIIFNYLSDGYTVKGYISLTPDYLYAPLLVFLRGGNRMLGLMNPANDFSLMRNYTVIATSYRGGISDGKDEFGGQEVNDVKNLIFHIPQLEKALDISLNPPHKYILGASRGGMEMFLALEQSMFLQSYFDKAVSLSGLMDLQVTMDTRPDMKNMFIRDFGLMLDHNKETWLNNRNPLQHCASLRKDLPFLIIQGTKDNRVHLDHGKKMYNALTLQGNKVTYWEIEDATHCLSNCPNRTEKIATWLETLTSSSL